MKENFYKGQKISIQKSYDDNKSVCNLNGDICVIDNREIFDNKEESLKNWIPVLLQDIINYHYRKFGKIDFNKQLDKLEEETKELLDAIQRVKENRNISDENVFNTLMNYVQDEYGDVIMSGCVILCLPDAMRHTFEKLGLRKYPDNFKHMEE